MRRSRSVIADAGPLIISGTTDGGDCWAAPRSGRHLTPTGASLVLRAFERCCRRGPCRRAALEQAQFDCALDGLRPGLHPELLVDRPQVGLDRVTGDIEDVCHLEVGAGRQQLENA